MPAHTVLLDFQIDPVRVGDEKARAELFKLVQNVLSKYFETLKFIYDVQTADGSLCLFTENNSTYVTVRFYIQGIITINIEYFKDIPEKAKFSLDSTRELQNDLEKVLDLLSAHALPPIERGGEPRYFPSADERILEYDIDEVLFEERSEFQKIQLVHSKTLGTMLVLDDLQNISEADLIYTESLMCRGVENYKGKEICILGGGDGALLYELLKEEPKHVVMLEIDEIVMTACNKYLKSICGDVLEQRSGENYDIVVGDCMVYLDKYIKEGKQFDYVFGDLTDIPISDTPTGEIWNFIRTVLEKSFNVLKPNGKFLTHGNGSSCGEALAMYEEQLMKLTPKVKFTTTRAFVPSFMEEWVFYQVIVDA